MNPPDPSLDPNRTVDHEVTPRPETVDMSQQISTGATGLYVPAPIADTPVGAPSIPGYRITAEIAKGGMGCVYAGHDLTLDREVAIKTLLPGANAERFITEAKITAKLPHPNIPPVYALGTLEDGTPWLAMKYIRGQTLAKLLSNGELQRPQLVQIFEQICQAVGFAHAQGVIHRDLKPLNVMVGAFGEVQVMDWGLAKELGRIESDSLGRESGESDDLQHTAAGTIMGTPGYMAPEQARGEVVDARADVFALGSILAAILTGQPAFVGTTARETITKAAEADLTEVLERLDRCGADAELVAIAKRCLAAAREDRPADGRVVAELVAAYRAGVEARLRQAETEAAQAVVRAEEQRKRRRQFNLAAGLIGVVLLAGLSVSLWQMLRANAAERQAVAERDAKDAALQAEQQALLAKTAALEAERAAKALAEQRRQQAETNLAYAKKGNEILGSIFTGLDPKANYATVGEFTQVLKNNLKKAVAELEGSAIGDPLEVAQLQNTLGLSLLGLGEPGRAIVLFEKSRATRAAQLGPDHPDTLGSMNNLAAGYHDAGQLDRALPLFEETLKLRKAKLGPDHPDTLTSMNNLAGGYRAAGKLDQALPLYEESLKLRKAKLGPDHHHTLLSMANLAAGYRDAGKLDQALPLYEETLKLMKAQLGPDHPHTLQSMGNFGIAYCDAKQGAKAAPLLKEFVAGQRKRFPKGDPRFAGLLAQVALALLKCEQFAVAEEMLRECLAIREKAEPEAWTTFNTLFLLGGSLLGQKKYAEAEPLLLKGYEGMKARFDQKPVADADRLALQQRLPEALDRLIALYTALDKPDEVKKYQQLRAKYPPAKEKK